MIDVQVHYRGQGSESRQLPDLPRPGDYLDHDGKLFSVSTVVFGRTVKVYAVHVSDTLAGELRQQWAGWGEPPADPAPTDPQRASF